MRHAGGEERAKSGVRAADTLAGAVVARPHHAQQGRRTPRLSLEAANYAWRNASKQAEAERQEFRSKTLEEGFNERVAMATEGREHIQQDMRKSLEENQQKHAATVKAEPREARRG